MTKIKKISIENIESYYMNLRRKNKLVDTCIRELVGETSYSYKYKDRKDGEKFTEEWKRKKSRH